MLSCELCITLKILQGSENELLGLITEFNKAVCETPLGSPLRRHKLMEAAKAVNRVRLCLGDPFEELTQKWVSETVQQAAFLTAEGLSSKARTMVAILIVQHCFL